MQDLEWIDNHRETKSKLEETKRGEISSHRSDRVVFMNLRDFFSLEGEFLILSLQSYIESGQAFTRVKVYCENMDLAADVVQDMAKYFKWEELDSEAEFAAEFEKFEQVCCIYFRV